MTVKIIGGALLILASVFYGRLKILEERRRFSLAEASVEFVRAVRDSIAHYAKPLSEICESVNIEPLEECGFLPLCRTDGIRMAWEAKKLPIPDKMRAVMGNFAERIGGGYREDELALCAIALSRLVILSTSDVHIVLFIIYKKLHTVKGNSQFFCQNQEKYFPD